MPGPPTRQTLIVAICVLAAALFLFFWGCPYIAIYGHNKLCIALYVVLLIVYVYGRGTMPRSRRRGSDRSSR
jgi:O-antigen/teichoic acid export membrane protein